MTKRRIERLNEQLKRELTDVLMHEVRDPRVGRLTVTDVRASSDLYSARVFLSSLGTEEEKSAAMDGLRAASSYIRGELGRRLHVRRIPELAFEWDLALEHAQRIEELLRAVRPPANPPTSGDADEEDGAE